MSNAIEVTLAHFAETSANARFIRTGEFSGVLDGTIITVMADELPKVEEVAEAEPVAEEAPQETTEAASEDKPAEEQ